MCHWIFSLKDLRDAAATGQGSYNIDYAEQVKGGIHGRDGKLRHIDANAVAAGI